MFKKSQLKNKIKRCQKEIKRIETTRARSQAALVAAILSHTEPSEDDVEYFNNYTSQIEEIRDRMHGYKNELEQLGK